MTQTSAPPDPGLPMRQGVTASCHVLPSWARHLASPWPHLLAAVCERLPALDADEWQARFDAGLVVDASGRPYAATAYPQSGTKLYYWREVSDEPALPSGERILAQDEHLLVADKPHFLPVQPSGRYVRETLLVRLRQLTGLSTLSPLHRLDLETAGLVLFAVDPPSRAAYQALFRERTITKVYEAIAPWRDDEGEGPWTLHTRLEEDPVHFMQMRTVPGQPNALTHVKLLDRQGPWARYELRPHTGKKHQLRAQMAHWGRPLKADRIYPNLLAPIDPADPATFNQPLRLLAKSLSFQDPCTGEWRQFVSTQTLRW